MVDRSGAARSWGMRCGLKTASSLSALGLALIVTQPAFAQAAATPTGTQQNVTSANTGDAAPVATNGAASLADSTPANNAPSAGGQGTQDIVVTGSRIARSGFNTPTPVAVVGAQKLQELAVTNVGDALFTVPAFRPGASPTTSGLTAGTIGSRFADLRGLGANRTLVLVDGRRFVSGTELGTVDLNAIPSILLQRTEVVTGGASAAYGSDAVAGVVNIIMDNKFEGIKGQAQYGVSEQGDGQDFQVGLAWGTKFAEGRGHFVIGGEYENSKPVGDCYQRAWCAEERQPVANATPGLNGIPAQTITTGVNTSSQTRTGIITGGPLKGTTFTDNGTPTPFTYGSLVDSLFQIGGSGNGQNAYLTNVYIKVPVKRETGYAHGTYEFTDWLTGFVEGNFARVDGRNIGGDSRNPGTSASAGLTISTSNPYIPAALQQTIAAYNAAHPTAPITSFPFGREGYDVGPSRGEDITKTYRGVIGFDIDIGHSWKANVYYQYGRSEYSQVIQNNQVGTYFKYAIDAVNNNGTITCRALVPGSSTYNPTAAAGCVPFNPFGQNNESAASIAYAYRTAYMNRTINENVESGSIQGNLFHLPAGPVSIAMGVEHRYDTAIGTTDPISQQLLFVTGNGNAINGRIGVTEGFVETDIPLLKDMFLAKSLSLNAAARRTHYTTAGSVTTWKAGGVYEPTDWLRFRATRSRDIRAPDMSELFDPAIRNQSTIQDTLTHNTDVVPFFSGGNPNLKPEKADTTTAGVVFQPKGFLRGFRVSFDYYKIHLQDAIAQLVAQNVVNQCNNGQTSYCQFVIRDSAQRLVQINTPYLNLNQVNTSGFDIVADYALPLSRISPSAKGTLNFDLTLSHVAHLTTIQQSGALDIAGVTGCAVTSFFECTPSWTYDGTINYTTGRLDLTAHGHYIPKSVYDPTLIGPEDPGYSPSLSNSINSNRVAAAFYLSLSVSYDIIREDRRKLQFYLGVDNALNKVPPLMPGRANNTFYDPVGRYFKGGIRFQY